MRTTIKVPRIMKLAIRLAGGIAKDTRTAEEMTAYYRDMSEEQYQFLKAKVWEGAKLKSGLFRYHPVYVAQRKMQRELQSKGYNDIFNRESEAAVSEIQRVQRSDGSGKRQNLPGNWECTMIRNIAWF